MKTNEIELNCLLNCYTFLNSAVFDVNYVVRVTLRRRIFSSIVFIKPSAQVDLTYLEQTPTFSVATEGLFNHFSNKFGAMANECPF